MLNISKQKLADVIWHAKKYEDNSSNWDEIVHSSFQDDIMHPLHDKLNTATSRSALTELVAGLSKTEKISLIALSIVGRGTVGAGEFDKAIELAKQENIDRTGHYLLGIPMVGAYLEEGVNKLGYSFEEVRSLELQDR